jgi:hypothetical protein
MKRTTFVYEISVYVELTGHEIMRLCELSGRHYDGVCQFASKQGGFLYGIKNQFGFTQNERAIGGYKVIPDAEWRLDDSVEVHMSWRQLDTLAKIAEGENRYALAGGVPIPGDLGKKIREVTDSIAAQRKRLEELVWEPSAPGINESVTPAT